MTNHLKKTVSLAAIFITMSAAVFASGRAPDRAFKPVVHTYSAGAPGIFVNAYLVETRNGVVAVDSTLTVSDSQALRAQLESLGKPLLAVLLTHGHPDHYNGVTNLLAGKSVPVYATAGTDHVIRENDALKEKMWKPMFGKEWPEKRTFPDHIVKDGQSLKIGGERFTVYDLGPGESHSDSYWVMEDADGEKTAFIGDTVLNGVHAYMSDGHSAAWLKNLDAVGTTLEKEGVKKLYPGHGAAGGPEILGWERSYIQKYRETVRSLALGAPSLSEDAKKQLVAAMKAFLPTDKLEFLIPLGADPVAKELAAEGAAK